MYTNILVGGGEGGGEGGGGERGGRQTYKQPSDARWCCRLSALL